jgi:hypothetical protein
MPRPKAPTTGKGLIVSMDWFTVDLLKQAEVAEDLTDKIVTGALVAQWIARGRQSWREW